jgi:hypothetical protein
MNVTKNWHIRFFPLSFLHDQTADRNIVLKGTFILPFLPPGCVDYS